MLVREHLSVRLMRVPNETEFPQLKRTPHALEQRDQKFLENLKVEQGERFFIRIAVSDEFEWYESDMLMISIKYDREGGDGSSYKLPCIMKPTPRRKVIKDFRVCAMWDLDGSKWSEWVTEFEHSPVRLCRRNLACNTDQRR